MRLIWCNVHGSRFNGFFSLSWEIILADLEEVFTANALQVEISDLRTRFDIVFKIRLRYANLTIWLVGSAA